MLREYLDKVFKMIDFMKTAFKTVNTKMAIDCSKRELTQLHWLFIGAVIFTAEYIIGLVIVTVSLNTQLENLQLLISDARTDIDQSASAVTPDDCSCQKDGSWKTTPYKDIGENEYVELYSIPDGRRSEDTLLNQLCCETDEKTLKKRVKTYMRHQRLSERSSLKRKTVDSLSKPRKRRSVLTLQNGGSEKSGKSDQQQKSNRTPRTPTCGTHLIGQFNRGFSEENGEILTQWTSESQGAFLINMIYYEDDGHIRATKSGYYYIYCQLHYTLIQRIAQDTEKGPDQSERHGVKYQVIQKSRPQIKSIENILISNEIKPNENDRDVSFSSFESTVVYLADGDVIFVKVWPQKDTKRYIISTDHDRTYFGATLLPQTMA